MFHDVSIHFWWLVGLKYAGSAPVSPADVSAKYGAHAPCQLPARSSGVWLAPRPVGSGWWLSPTPLKKTEKYESQLG